MRFTVLAMLMLLAACGKDAGVTQPTPKPNYHDPEILFHFAYRRDSAGVLHNEPHPDTAIMRWFRDGTPPQLLAQVEITGIDTVCAYFLVTSGTPLYFALGWTRGGVATIGLETVGFDPSNPDSYDPYWDIGMWEDTLTGTSSEFINSSRTTSFCPQGMRRDSITAQPAQP